VAVAVGDHGPVPTVFFAATRNTYLTPVVSPVTVADRVVRTPSLNVIQVVEVDRRYCTT
jgi:hypothetical protein